MKTLGETAGGGAIVEMNGYEHDALVKLENAVREEGIEQTVFPKRRILRGGDLSVSLQAILHWVSLKCGVTSLKESIETFQNFLENPA